MNVGDKRFAIVVVAANLALAIWLTGASDFRGFLTAPTDGTANAIVGPAALTDSEASGPRVRETGAPRNDAATAGGDDEPLAAADVSRRP